MPSLSQLLTLRLPRCFLTILAISSVFPATAQVWLDNGFTQVSSQEDAQAGSALAMDGDTLVVGVPNLDKPGTTILTHVVRAGAVEIYSWQQNGWVKQQTLYSPNPAPDDRFGAAVALQGNVLLVGAPGYDSNVSDESDVGEVYVFTRINDGLFSNEGTLVNGIFTGSPQYGASLDLVNDENNTYFAIIGAPRRDSGESLNTGTVRVKRFSVNPTNGNISFESADTWDLYPPIDVNQPPQADQHFGFSVAAAKAFCTFGNCPLSYYLAVGMPYFDTANETNAGRVIVYQFTPSTAPDVTDFTEKRYIIGNQAHACLGIAVDLDGGKNLFSPLTVAVGVLNGKIPNSNIDAGRVDIHEYSGGTWSLASSISPPLAY